jgi:hypothetical protein
MKDEPASHFRSLLYETRATDAERAFHLQIATGRSTEFQIVRRRAGRLRSFSAGILIAPSSNDLAIDAHSHSPPELPFGVHSWYPIPPSQAIGSLWIHQT